MPTNNRVAEAWVWTLPEQQRRGYARQVTSAWAHDLLLQHKIPFCSHKAANLASRAVARSLGLQLFLTATAYEQRLSPSAIEAVPLRLAKKED